MIEWRKPELNPVEADCSAFVRAAVKYALNQKFGYRRAETMLYEEFCEWIGRDDITYSFYKDVIEPMYIAAPEEIDKMTFCHMLDEDYLYAAQRRYFERKSSVSPLENDRCRKLATMLHDLGLSFNELKDNPYCSGSKSWDLWECTIHHLEDLKND